MESVSGENWKRDKWYNRDEFSLVPKLTLKKRDGHNTNGFTFKWLFLTAWSLNSPSFEVAFVCSSHWGIGFIGLLPYLRWAVTIPFSNKLATFSYKYLWRKP